MRRSLIFIAPFIVALMLIACRRSNPEAAALLARADSLLNPPPSTSASQTPPAGGPQGALRLLDSVQHQARTAWPKADRMRYEVLLAEAMNKSYKPFATDSVLKQVVRYYDRHGSSNFWSSERLISWLRDGRVVTKVSAANQRLKAHYLLGCAYRDMGEAPAAINAWQEAVDCADTLSTDCDYKTLYRVYGQMAETYLAQQLTDKEIEAYQKYSQYAQKAGDVYSYLRGKEMQIQAYYQKQDTAAVFLMTEEIRKLYLKHNMPQAAARVYPMAISVAVQYEQWHRADSMMRIFESQSGLFNRYGMIAKEYELYYQSKGFFYLGTGMLDSAETYFRRLVSCHHQIEGFRGLKSLYEGKHQADSFIYYGHLYDDAINHAITQIDADAVQQADALYNYRRNQNKADVQTKKAHRAWQGIIWGATLTLLAGTLAYTIFRRKYKASLHQASELEYLYDSQEQQVVALEKKNSELREENQKFQCARNEEDILNSDIVKKFKKDAKLRITQKVKSKEKNQDNIIPESEWLELREMIKQSLPSFYSTITNMVHFSKQEFRACILFRLNFKGNEIAALLDTPDSRVSRLKEIIIGKLFEQKETGPLSEMLRSL
ncbi:MAG: hypothetical protein IKO12_01215 [Bacteroidaceae bacterium]|nr:hypothetical protein [Bacteroidaceae bacterium]